MPYEMEDVAFSSRDQDCLLFLCQNQVEVCAPTTTELLALYNATEALKLWERKPQKAVFLSDSLSALQSLTSETPDDSQKRLMDNVNELAQSTKVVLQWIPAHTGIVGNEIADQLAKEGRKKDKPSSHLSYKEIRTLIRNRQKSTFIASIGGYTPQKDPLHQLSRHEQTTIFCLRTGHWTKRTSKKNWYSALGSICDCGKDYQTPNHFLQSCPLYNRERQHIWPVSTSMDDKLWGSENDLHLTTHFAILTGQRI